MQHTGSEKCKIARCDGYDEHPQYPYDQPQPNNQHTTCYLFYTFNPKTFASLDTFRAAACGPTRLALTDIHVRMYTTEKEKGRELACITHSETAHTHSLKRLLYFPQTCFLRTHFCGAEVIITVYMQKNTNDTYTYILEHTQIRSVERVLLSRQKSKGQRRGLKGQ